VLLQEIHDFFVADLGEDFADAVALLQVLDELVRRGLGHLRDLVDALQDFLLRGGDVFLFANLLEQERGFHAVFGTGAGGIVDFFLLLLDDVLRDAALLVFADDVVDHVARLVGERGFRQVKAHLFKECGDELVADGFVVFVIQFVQS